MGELVYTYGGTLVRLDDTVIEVFRQIVTGSQRTPLVWSGADLQPRKGDQLRVTIGVRQGDAFYCDTVTTDGAFTFDVPASEEPRLRAFLDEAQRRGAAAAQGA